MLKTYNPLTAITLSVNELNQINKLIERDKAKALAEESYAVTGETIVHYSCPCCNKWLGNPKSPVRDQFCSKCGQRLDIENVAL